MGHLSGPARRLLRSRYSVLRISSLCGNGWPDEQNWLDDLQLKCLCLARGLWISRNLEGVRPARLAWPSLEVLCVAIWGPVCLRCAPGWQGSLSLSVSAPCCCRGASQRRRAAAALSHSLLVHREILPDNRHSVPQAEPARFLGQPETSALKRPSSARAAASSSTRPSTGRRHAPARGRME